MQQRKLILHCGHHKTGTSTLQTVFREAAAQTPDLLYPVSGRGKGLAHHNLALSFQGKGRFNKKMGGWDALRDEIGQKQGRNIVVSTEALEGVSPGRIAKELDQLTNGRDMEVRVVLYIRPHASRILSGYSQKAKTGQMMASVPEFVERVCERGAFDFAEQLSAWKDTFGDRLHLEPFFRSAMVDGDIVSDFAAKFLPEFQELFGNMATAQVSRNVAPNLKVLAVMRMASMEFGLSENHKKSRFFETRVLAPLRKQLEQQYVDCQDKAILTSADIAMIRERYMEDAGKLDRLMGTGSLFRDELNSAAGRAEKPGTAANSPEEILGDDFSVHQMHLQAMSGIFKKINFDVPA